MDLTAASIPSDPRRVYTDDAAKRRAKRDRRKAAGKPTRGTKGNVERQRKTRHDKEYLSREIVAWDGEGITDAFGAHHYVLLSSSENDRLVNRAGIPTMDTLDLIHDRALEQPKALHVIYGGGYDFNSWLASMPRELVEALASDESVDYGPYRITWRMGRFFRIKRDGIVTTVYDVVPFFQCAFVKACDEYLGDKFIDRDEIVASKARRGSFTLDELTGIIKYNDSELVNLVELVRELRLRLWKVGIKPTQWYGPGAIAAAVLGEKGVGLRLVKHDDVSFQERVAYSGGRFEVFQYGHFSGRTYQYDINSAYPAALRYVPSLVGRWVRRRNLPARFPDFSLVHVTWDVKTNGGPNPLWVRQPNGVIYYPSTGSGWYWGIEINAAMDYRPGVVPDKFLEFVPDDPSDKPFSFIEPMYNKRRALKAAKDGAHVGLKLGLNSMYGKLAQQIGWREERGELKLPPYHSLSWAGFTTAYCRSLIMRAITLDPDAIIATETDAVFTRRPLPLDIGTGLGQWEASEWDDLVYIQSGFYAGYSDGKAVVKSRGIDRGQIDYQTVYDAVATNSPIKAQLTRYVGVRLAMAQGWQKWRRWETVPKEIKPEPQGKRASLGFKRVGETFTRTLVPFAGGESVPYPVQWIEPDPEADHLLEMRLDHYSEDWETVE